MKLNKALLLVFVSACSSLFAQSTKKITLSTDDKKTQHGFSLWMDVRIQSKDTSFFYPLHVQKKEVIEVLGPGEYTFTFNSVFGEKVKKQLTIGTKKSYKLKVKGLNAVYTEVPSTVTFMDKLQTNDTVYIITSGLETISYEKLGVTKMQDGRYKALQFQGLTDDVFNEYIVNEKTYLQTCTFEKVMKELPVNTCIPSITSFCYKKQYYSMLDKSCPDNTLSRIKSMLFLVTSGGQ